jgi:hypothetical protein
VLYGASGSFAAYTVTSSSSVAHRTWGGFAWPVYAAAALAALILALLGRRVPARRMKAARLLLALVVLVGAVAIPLAAEVQWRADRGPEYAHSEVVITESAAAEAVRGRDPYAAHFTSSELVSREPGIRENFPYFPGMAVFGMPRALPASTAWTDARLFFALATVAAAIAALWHWRVPVERRLLAFQVLVVLPTGALFLTTGGDDLPVLALCLLALVLLQRGRPLASAVAIAAAASLKLTAWPVLLALAVAAPELRRPGGVRSPLVLALTIVTLGLLPAVAAGPADFAEDVVLFPLGLTTLQSPAASTTLGSVVVGPVAASSPVNLARVALTAALLAAALLVATAILVAIARARAPRLAPVGAAAEAAAGAGILLTTLIMLMPIARPGYLVYPMNLLLWAVLLREPAAAPQHVTCNRRRAPAAVAARAGEGAMW